MIGRPLLPPRRPGAVLSDAEAQVLLDGWAAIVSPIPAGPVYRLDMVQEVRLALYRYAHRHVCRSYRGSWRDAALQVGLAEGIVAARVIRRRQEQDGTAPPGAWPPERRGPVARILDTARLFLARWPWRA